MRGVIRLCESKEKSCEKSYKNMDINQMIKSYLRIGQHIDSCLKVVAACVVLCLSMQSCDQGSESFVSEEPGQMPISMNAASVAGMKASRALIEGDAHLQRVGFVAYGKVTTIDGKNSAQVFNGQEVVYDSLEGFWDYNPKKYWYHDVYYCFGAYAPTDLSSISVASGDYSLEFTVPNWQVLNKGTVDLVVATSNGSEVYYVSENGGEVELRFNHVLSCLEVRLKKEDDSGNSYTLKGLTYNNVPVSGGRTTYTLDYGKNGNSQMGAVALGSMTVCSSAQLSVGTGVQGSPAVTFSHLLVPFTLTGSDKLTMSVNYIAEMESDNSFEYPREITTDLTAMQAGKKYILTLTFTGGGEIIPKLELADWSIAKWNDQDIEDDPKYNW